MVTQERCIRVKRHAGVGTIQMQDTASRNAIGCTLVQEFLEALEQLARNHVRAIVLRAAPGAGVWSSGHNVRELPQTHRDPLGWGDPLRQLVRAIEEFAAPVIGMVDGSVWGGGCEVALACDVLVATPTSSFALTVARLGVPYNAAGLMTFMNRMPLCMLKELIFTADPIDARRAAELGMVNHVVPANEIDSYTYALAERMCANSPLTIAVIKEQLRLLKSARSLSPEMFERLQGLRRVVYDSRDYQEGIQAFLQKRAPEFHGE